MGKRGPKPKTEKLIKNCKFCGKEFLAKTNGKYCSRKCATKWRFLYGKRYIPNPTGKAKHTLCWDCEKATGGSDCPWANEFKPVPGWKATPTMVMVTTQTLKRAEKLSSSFLVHDCPLFKRG